MFSIEKIAEHDEPIIIQSLYLREHSKQTSLFYTFSYTLCKTVVEKSMFCDLCADLRYIKVYIISIYN